MNNFVYAADKNYNKQLFYSIYSLLDNSNTHIDLHIIHKEPDTFSEYKNYIEKNFTIFPLQYIHFNLRILIFQIWKTNMSLRRLITGFL